jgi:uncharacterized protein YbjT (DUF2867 family)
MRVAIAGAHGKIGQRLTRLLSVRGDQVVGLIRNPDHAGDVREVGAKPVVCDLEQAGLQEVAVAVEGCDAVVFAAGAGPGSGATRKQTMDRGGAVLLATAAERAGVPRYLLISAMGLERADKLRPDDVFGVYLQAKAESEQDLRERDLQWTILRPGRLTDGAGTGLVKLGPPPLEPGSVSRQDVAEALVELLDQPATAGLTLELVAGHDDIPAAVAACIKR